MSQDNKAIAEKYQQIGEAFIELSALFLAGGNTKGEDAGDEKAPAKSTRKPKSVPKPDADVEHSEDDVRTALKGLMEKHGKDKMIEALGTVGADKLANVDDSQYAELMATVEEMMAAKEEAPEPAKGKAAAKKTTKKKGPTLDEVTEKFKELIGTDKALAKSVLKELGVAKVSELDEDQYQDAIDAAQAAIDGADDDML